MSMESSQRDVEITASLRQRTKRRAANLTKELSRRGTTRERNTDRTKVGTNSNHRGYAGGFLQKCWKLKCGCRNHGQHQVIADRAIMIVRGVGGSIVFGNVLMIAMIVAMPVVMMLHAGMRLWLHHSFISQLVRV